MFEKRYLCHLCENSSNEYTNTSDLKLHFKNTHDLNLKEGNSKNEHQLSHHESNSLSLQGEAVITDLEVGKGKESADMNDNYIQGCLEKSIYPALLKYQTYQEIDASVLNILNQDWTDKPYIKIACGKLLAGSILVEENKVLLINCLEIYHRKPHIDPHYRRFSYEFRIISLPSVENRYKTVNITSNINDNSKELIIGTLVFNALVTSSIRLDQDCEPEVGSSTFNFSPTRNTKIYISSLSLSAAINAIEKESQLSNKHDLDSHLRQVKSKLANPNTYTCTRFSSEWTDALPCRPYTIFTLVDDDYMTLYVDAIIASHILAKIAYSMRFQKGLLKKSFLMEVEVKEETAAKKIFDNIVDLYGDRDTLNIIHKKLLKNYLSELAEMATSKLEFSNENVKFAIIDIMKKFA